MNKTTEQDSKYSDLELMPLDVLLKNINTEDKTVPFAVEQSIPQIAAFAKVCIEHMKAGGRLFYIGAGTSGRLGIIDASECPPTFGVPFDMVIGIIAGGDSAIRRAVEFAEDDRNQAWIDLEEYHMNDKDVIVGIAASGTTPYVIGGLTSANARGLITACIVCNSDSPIAKIAQYPIEVMVGPEFLTGSTRMKSGTAQKLVLNMLSTSIMIGLGRVKGNKMVDMQMTNTKLVDRGVKMVMNELKVDYDTAEALLKEHGSVRIAVSKFRNA